MTVTESQLRFDFEGTEVSLKLDTDLTFAEPETQQIDHTDSSASDSRKRPNLRGG